MFVSSSSRKAHVINPAMIYAVNEFIMVCSLHGFCCDGKQCLKFVLSLTYKVLPTSLSSSIYKVVVFALFVFMRALLCSFLMLPYFQ